MRDASRIVYTDQAEDDLAGIWSYIARDNETAATETIQALNEQCIALGNAPEMGRRRQELGKGLRSFPIGSYVIFYKLTELRIEILRVLHGALGRQKQPVIGISRPCSR